MRAFWKLLFVQAKLFLREPIAAFFTIVFAPMMLVLFGTIYGNTPTPMFGGKGTVDVSVPAYIAMIIVCVALISLPIGTTTARDAGVLRRFRATPLPALTYLAADVIVYFFMTLLGVAALVLVGKIGYGMRFEGNIFSVLAGFTLSALSFFSLGYVLASVAPTARVAQTVGMVVAYPMMFLSGAGIPLEILPQGVRSFSRFIPLTHVVTLMRGLWAGDPWGDHLTEVAVLTAVMIVGVVLSIRFFRWK
jgi:ABC-2 type transport system permease protein